jgi:hypothetical protein
LHAGPDHVPGDVSLPARFDVDALRRIAVERHTVGRQQNLNIQGLCGVVVHLRAHARPIAVYEKARRLQFDEQRLGADQFAFGLTHASVHGRGARVRHPGGQVLGQFHRDLHPSVLIGGQLGAEEGRVLEVLPD